MIRILYANGCSFTEGKELEEEDPEMLRLAGREDMTSRLQVRAYRNKLSWPAHLAKLVGAETVINAGRSGGSNARMVRMTYDYVCSYLAAGGIPEELLVCLGFTHLVRAERFESLDARTDAPFDDGWALMKMNLSRQTHGAGKDSLKANQLYYRYLHTETQATITFVHQLLNMQFALASLGVRFHFHDAMGVNSEPIARHGLQTRHLLRFIQPGVHRSIHPAGQGAMEYKDGYTFEEWLILSGAPRARGQHPLAEAHQQWAALLYSEISKTVVG
jgi:hypothetical protein